MRAALQRTKSTDNVELTHYRKDYPISQLHINQSEYQSRSTEQASLHTGESGNIFADNYVYSTSAT